MDEELTEVTEEIFEERLVSVERMTKVTKGGKRLSFRALVVVGNKNGLVGYGIGKGRDVQLAIQKGVKLAKKNLIEVKIVNSTIPHESFGKWSSGRVFLKPAKEGTGIVASAPVRAVVELAGIKNILTKCMGNSTNPVNIIYATIEALKKLRRKEEIEAIRFGHANS